MQRIETVLTRALGLRYPIIAAPMFLVSGAPLLKAVAAAGGMGLVPSLNFRETAAYRAFLNEFPEGIPFGVNLIMNNNPRLEADLAVSVERRVPLVVTSLGDPSEVVRAVHGYGGKVFCDVIGLRHAEKAATAGADALVAVAAGAGGHAGKISPLVLAPWLKEHTGLPVIIAGGISTGSQMLAGLALGADGVYIGTRFIATSQSAASPAYKRALVEAKPEMIEYTSEVSGVPANFLQDSLERFRQGGKPWEEVWSAGHGVAFIHDVPSASEMIARIVSEYQEAKALLP